MNRRLFKPLTEWTPTDVQALVEKAIPEGQRLEYKKHLPLDRDRDRAELAKDVSGLANAVGSLSGRYPR